jgi:hypothetical protein
VDTHEEDLNRLMALPRTGETTAPVVWHYTNRAGLEGILGSHTIWASDATTMNDPLELQHGHQVIEDALARARLATNVADGVRRHLDFAREVMNRGTTFVLSACTNGDSLPQWHAYGDDLKGYAIGFRVPGEALNLLEHHPFDASADTEGHGDINQYVSVWRDVLYDTGEQAVEADTFIDFLARLVDLGANDPALTGFRYSELLVRAYAPPGYAGIVTRLKHHHWAPEEEVRITATALDAHRFHAGPSAARTRVNLTGWTRPSGISGTSTYASPSAMLLPLAAVRSGPLCPRTDLRDLLDSNGYDKVDALTSDIAYRGR